MHNKANYRCFRILILPCRTLCVLSALALLNVIAAAGAVSERPLQVSSPDGNVVIKFDVKDLEGQHGCLVYAVAYKGRPVVADSRLGLAIKDTVSLQQVSYDLSIFHQVC